RAPPASRCTNCKRNGDNAPQLQPRRDLPLAWNWKQAHQQQKDGSATSRPRLQGRRRLHHPGRGAFRLPPPTPCPWSPPFKGWGFYLSISPSLAVFCSFMAMCVQRWSGVVRMGAVVGGGKEGEEDEELRQTKEQAAARRRWEALIREQKIKTLTPREAGYTFKLTDKVLLDVRPSNERQKAWVKGSTWIPIFDVDTSVDLGGLSKKVSNFVMDEIGRNFVQQVEEKFSKDTDIMLVCQKGLRSLAACEQLYNAGFENLFWVQGGLEAAEEEDFEREGSQPFKLAAIGGISEFFGWTDQQRAQAAKEGLGYRLVFTGRLVGALVLLDALFLGAQRIGPMLQEMQPR
ncbi:Rhodanese-like domain-containing protein 11, chloroplastic, partial [Zea mays]